MFPVGFEVGAERWPLSSAHPDCWGKPWRGVVVADPDLECAQRHCICLDQIAVAWEFGKTYWESADRLRPYDEDLSAWVAARRAARRSRALVEGVQK